MGRQISNKVLQHLFMKGAFLLNSPGDDEHAYKLLLLLFLAAVLTSNCELGHAAWHFCCYSCCY